MKNAIAVLFLGCLSSAAFADAADQATLKVYKVAASGHEADLSDLKSDSLVLQQAEMVQPAESAGSEVQTFSLGDTRYSYSVSYAPASDYEVSSVRLTETSASGATRTFDTTVRSGKTTMVKTGGYVLAFSMEPAAD